MGRKTLKAGRTGAVPDVASAGVTILPGRPMPEWLVPAVAETEPEPAPTPPSEQSAATEHTPAEFAQDAAQPSLVAAGASAGYAPSNPGPAAPTSPASPAPAWTSAPMAAPATAAPAPAWMAAAPAAPAAPVTTAAPSQAHVTAAAAASAGLAGAGYPAPEPEPYPASARYAPSPTNDTGSAYAPSPVTAPAPAYAPDPTTPPAPTYPPGPSYGLRPDPTHPGTPLSGEPSFDPQGSTDLSAPPQPGIPGSWAAPGTGSAVGHSTAFPAATASPATAAFPAAPTFPAAPPDVATAATSAVTPGAPAASPTTDPNADPNGLAAAPHAAPATDPATGPGATAPELTPEQVVVLARLADLLVRGEYPPLPEAAGLGNPPTSPFDTDYIPAPPPRPEPRRRSGRTALIAGLGVGAVALVAAGVMFGPGLLGSLTAEEPAPAAPATLTMPTTVGDLVALTGDAATNELVPVFGLGYRPTGVTTTSAYASAADSPMALGAMATTLPPSADAAGQIMMWASRMGATTGDPVVGSGATAGITCADATGLPAASDGAFCVWSGTGDRGQTYVVGTSAESALDSTASFVSALNGSPASTTS